MNVKRRMFGDAGDNQFDYLYSDDSVKDLDSALEFIKNVGRALETFVAVKGCDCVGSGEMDFEFENRYYRSVKELLEHLEDTKDVLEQVRYEFTYKGSPLFAVLNVYAYKRGLPLLVVGGADDVMAAFNKAFVAAFNKLT